ncbi:Tau-tubulin kinase 2 [Trichinella pseudospiralis]|uniref:Tau-tubulin kinase 2 n=1 Tax=Trichinella pseudospiralis TaxID=6337 RepID=A0A0V1F144_TRIPS|nr:Tau-tubulin kinase 2 [Trichinella pseudospiralis]
MASDSEDGKVENFKPGECIDERWIVEKLLGVGGCASVYQVKDAVTNSINAMKVEMAAQKVDILKFEMTVMIELNKVNDRHVCKVVGGGKNAAFCYIVMTLVGPNFFTILNSLKRKSTDRSRPKFSTRSSVFLALNSLEALQDLHQCGYLHRDIKPQNFAIGRAPDYRKVYLLDFGMCRKYVKDNGDLRRPREKCAFRGTIYFASVDALKGEEQSRKDDVWSWFFMMIRLSTGTIAWKGYVPPKHIPPFKQMEEYSKIKETALSNMKEFCKHCPEEFCNIGEHLKTLGYFDKPNYELCYENMNAISKRMGLEDLPLDWEPQEKRQEQKSTGEEQKSNKEQKPDDKKVIKSLLKPQDQ